MKKFTFLMTLVLGFALNAMALNPYAYGVSVTNDGNGNAVVNYSLNAEATAAAVVFYNGDTEASSVALTDLAAGAHSATVALPTEAGTYTVKIRVNGTVVEAPTKEATYYSFWSPYGIAIDKDPASANFGRLLITEAQGNVPASGYHSSSEKSGIYAFNPDFTPVKNGDAPVCYKGGLTFKTYMSAAGSGSKAFSPIHVAISEDGRIFASVQDSSFDAVVYELSQDLQTWTPVISGIKAGDGTLVNDTNAFVAGMNVSMDVKGAGENLKLLLYSCNMNGCAAYSQAGFRLDEYNLGTATQFTGVPTHIALFDGAYGLASNYAAVYYDRAQEGAYWFTASRGGNSGQPNLVHFNANGVRDFYSEATTYYGGAGMAQHNNLLYMGGNSGFIQAYEAVANDSTMTITTSGDQITTGIGRSVNAIEFDYAENMYACSNSGEKLVAFAMPYSGIVETPVTGYEYSVEEISTDTIIYSWDGNQTDAVTEIGGTATAMGGNANTVVGKSSKLNWCLNLGKGYSNGTNYIKITLDTPLKGGETITTGCYVTGSTKPTADVVYGINFAGENELTLTYDADDETASQIPYISTNAAPEDLTLTVPAEAAGKSEIWIYRKSGSTTLLVSKFVVTRAAAEPEPADDIIWSEYLGDGAGAGAYSNQYKYGHKADQTSINCVNIQHPGFATADGIYLTAPVAISSCSLTDSNIDGAGICVHLSNFTAKTTEFTITCADNSVYTCYIWNENGTDTPTALDEIKTEEAVKFFQNGQIYIRKGDAVYTISGLRIE